MNLNSIYQKLLAIVLITFGYGPISPFDNLVEASKQFNAQTAFPTQANRIAAIAGNNTDKQKQIEQQAQNVTPIIDAQVMTLIKDFLSYKLQSGSPIEKKLYQSMDPNAFIDRLLIKRPLMFMTGSDSYLLRDGSKGSGGFDKIGTAAEKSPLVLAEYLSYDEMQIAALIGVSVPTYFINNGNRYNNAQPGQPGTFEETGVYTGLVGARFERPGRMEWQHMLVTPEQNTAQNGYGAAANQLSPQAQLLAIWSKFYGMPLATYSETQGDTSGRFIPIDQTTYLDSAIYKKRMKLVIKPFLLDANTRGKQEKKKAYCHVVGLGLGVWQVIPDQARLMLEVYADIIQANNLSNISDIDFSWFSAQYQNCGGTRHLESFKTADNDITLHFSKRNPADKLISKDAGKLLVAMYAWDSNAYPGNEYWDGALSASGDPAAACCSTIPELQNPLINPNVSSKNLKTYQ